MKTLIKFIINILLIAVLTSSTVLSVSAVIEGDLLTSLRFGAVSFVVFCIAGYLRRQSMAFAAITVLSRYSNVLENNSFNGSGIQSFTQVFAATSALVLRAAKEQHVCYAQLTGAMTINATLTNLKQFDIVFLHFSTDGTQRIVTFGTGFISSGTLTIAASKDATAWGIFDGTNIKILGREVQA